MFDIILVMVQLQDTENTYELLLPGKVVDGLVVNLQ